MTIGASRRKQFYDDASFDGQNKITRMTGYDPYGGGGGGMPQPMYQAPQQNYGGGGMNGMSSLAGVLGNAVFGNQVGAFQQYPQRVAAPVNQAGQQMQQAAERTADSRAATNIAGINAASQQQTNQSVILPLLKMLAQGGGFGNLGQGVSVTSNYGGGGSYQPQGSTAQYNRLA